MKGVGVEGKGVGGERVEGEDGRGGGRARVKEVGGEGEEKQGIMANETDFLCSPFSHVSCSGQ